MSVTKQEITVTLIDPEITRKNLIKNHKEVPAWTALQYKHAEFCGRTCYDSTNRITDDSYKKFIKMIKDKGHLSVMEHFEVILRGKISVPEQKKVYDLYYTIQEDPGFRLLSPVRVFRTGDKPDGDSDDFILITNYRFWLKSPLINSIWKYETDFLDPYNDLSDSEKIRYFNLYRRFTIKAEIPISLSREINRHRCLSISEKSTRYCKFDNKDKIDGTSFIKVDFDKIKSSTELSAFNKNRIDNLFSRAFNESLLYYGTGKAVFNLKNDQIREVLPLGLMSTVVYSGFMDAFFDVKTKRSDSHAHPNAREFARQLDEIMNSDELIPVLDV